MIATSRFVILLHLPYNPGIMDALAPQEITEVAEQTNAAPAGLDTRRMFSAALIVMLFFLLSRVTGLLREVILSDRFGTTAQYDAYLAAFRVPDLLFQLIAGGALGSAFIPIFAGLWLKTDKADAWLLFSRILNLITLILVVLAAIAAYFSVPLVRQVLAPGFTPEQDLLTAELMQAMLLGTIVFGASGLVMGALNATQHFVSPAAAPVVYNLAIIGAAYFLAPSMGVKGLAIGVVVGSAAHLLVQIPALLRKGVKYTPSISVRDPDVINVAKLMGPRVLGLFLVQANFLVNTIIASSLVAGSLSALNYAWLLMLLPQGIVAQAIATAAFPTFSAQYAAGQMTALRHTFSQTLRTVVFLVVPAAVALYVLGHAVIGVLLEHGAFTEQSTEMVFFALQFYLLGLLAHSALEIVVRGFYAAQNTLIPVVVGIGAMGLNIVLSLALVGALSFGGLALANTVATTLEMVILLWLLSRRLHGIEGKQIALTFLRSVVAAGAMAVALWIWVAWTKAVTPPALDVDWVAAVGGVLIALAIYGLASWLLRSEELRLVIGMVRRRTART
ncbi:MAG: murein biosynthesis integral membrane protein MurJ [Anaerolineales bacterium]|nr:murein biosynthesis integral membrane protein MurJ [Anaerolineales bacterium]